MIRKAIIPIAGKGTRLMPVTGVVPKAMFPIVCGSQSIKCLLHLILEQVMSAEIEHVGIIVSQWQIEMVKQYIESIPESSMDKMPVRIEYIIQPSPKGFGDAILRSAEFIRDDPFLLLLGDHLYIEKRGEQACAAQVISAFNSFDAVAMIGVQQVPASEISKVGVTKGIKFEEDIYLCNKFVEKPNLKTACQKLVTDGLPEGQFLAHCGIYAFTPEIFDCLNRVNRTADKTKPEIELAHAQVLLLKNHPQRYFLREIAGRAYDTGTPQGYAYAQYAFQRRSQQEAVTVFTDELLCAGPDLS